MIKYTIEDIKMERDFQLLSPKFQSYLVEFELYMLFKQLRVFNMNTQRTYELMAAGLVPHDMDLATPFIENMYIVTELFRGRAEKTARARHLWIGGHGISKVRRGSKLSQEMVYKALVEWESDLDKTGYQPCMQFLLHDNIFMHNFNRMLDNLFTMGDYNIRTNIKTIKETFGKEEVQGYGN